MKIVITQLCLLFGLIVLGQETNVDNTPIPPISISSIGYQNFYNDEQHSQFLMDWRVNEKNSLMINGYYDTNLLGDVFKTQLLFKREIVEKFYIFSGVEMGMERTIIGGAASRLNYKVINGIGYQIQDNFMIEAISESILGTQNFGGYGAGTLLKVQAKYKF